MTSKTIRALRTLLWVIVGLCVTVILLMMIVGIWWDTIPPGLGSNLGQTGFILFFLGGASILLATYPFDVKDIHDYPGGSFDE